MQLSRLRQGDPTVAIGTELDVIAAVVIGGGSLHGGEGSVFGSIVGALIMAFLRNGCQQMGWPNYIQEIIIGVIIVVAVALDRLRLSSSSRRIVRGLTRCGRRAGSTPLPRVILASAGSSPSWHSTERTPSRGTTRSTSSRRCRGSRGFGTTSRASRQASACSPRSST